MKPITAIIVLILVASLSVAGCTAGLPGTSSPSPTQAPTTTPSNIPQVASSDPSLSMFASLLDKANLTDLLNGPDNFTVFAPDNAAFSKVDASTLAGWQNNSTSLRSVLLYHIVPKKLSSNELTGIGTLTTLNGLILPYYVTGTTIRVDNATVTKGDINATNGVIYKVDSVLVQPSSA
ncbi:MAG: fasciclin domain-containing protein [Halobacteriota archaeon]